MLSYLQLLRGTHIGRHTGFRASKKKKSPNIINETTALDDDRISSGSSFSFGLFVLVLGDNLLFHRSKPPLGQPLSPSSLPATLLVDLIQFRFLIRKKNQTTRQNMFTNKNPMGVYGLGVNWELSLVIQTGRGK